jgi:signal transduction histidine kinase
LFGLGVSWWLAAEMRLSAENEAQATADQVAANVAEHMRLVVAAMKTLSRSQSLARADLGDAYQYAKLLAADLGHHIGLAVPDGTQLFNTRAPFGSPLPRRAHATSYTQALATGQPSISNVIIGAITKRPLVTIDVPLPTPAGPRVLGTSTDVATIGAVLERTPLKRGWKGAIVDGDGRFIARTLNPELMVGELSVPEVIAVAKSDQTRGRFSNRSHEGEDLYSFFAKVPGTPWTVVIGTPMPVFLAPLRGTLAVVAACGGAAMAVTMLVAWMLGRRLDAAALRLTADADALGRGDPLPLPGQTIAEFEQVEIVLHEAARLARRREDELALAREVAERSAAAKNRLLAAANHDLRQPLHVFGLGLELLRSMLGDSKQLRVVDSLGAAQANMAGMIQSLLDIARADGDGLAPRIEPVDLGQLVGKLVEETRPVAADRGLALRLHCRFSHVVATDRELLARVLRNLVHNAIRYTPEGGILVGLRRRAGTVAVEVWDTGLGIPADKLEMIWEEFYRIDTAEHRVAGGLGLGLAIVRRLSDALGCRVEVRSRSGRGSLFRVLLPAAECISSPPPSAR